MVELLLQSLSDPNVGGFMPMVQYPGDRCCTLFDDNYFGRAGARASTDGIENYRKTICHNDTHISINLHASGWGDKVDSYICGKNVWFDFCNNGQNDSCDGAGLRNSGAGYIKNQRINYHGGIMSTAVLGPYDPAQIGAVTLFEENDCSGASGRFYWDPLSNASGTMYNEEDVYFAGTRNNSMNSITVPAGYIAEVYDGHGLDANKQTFVGAYKDSSQELVCHQAPYIDQLSSIIVKRQPQGIANAYWQGITSSESQTQTYHVGVQSSTMERSQWEEAERMNAALDLGLTFLSFFFPPVALIPRQHSEVQRDVATTYGYDHSLTSTTTCTIPEGVEGGAGIWQWVVSTEDGSVQSFTHHTVCRTGEDWNTPPECPYYACANANCDCIPNWETL